jgi:hypothetical protein
LDQDQSWSPTKKTCCFFLEGARPKLWIFWQGARQKKTAAFFWKEPVLFNLSPQHQSGQAPGNIGIDISDLGISALLPLCKQHRRYPQTDYSQPNQNQSLMLLLARLFLSFALGICLGWKTGKSESNAATCFEASIVFPTFRGVGGSASFFDLLCLPLQLHRIAGEPLHPRKRLDCGCGPVAEQ